LKTQFGKRTLQSEICVLCGEREATTKENIPPKALFMTKPLEYLLVPACEECNHSSKLDDEYLLHAMTGGSLRGLGREVWKKKVMRKLADRPGTRMGLRERMSIQKIEIWPHQNMLMPVLHLHEDRIEKSIRKLAAGLYWWHTESIIAANAEMRLQMLNPANGPRYLNHPRSREISRRAIMGIYSSPEVQETFFYTWAIGKDLALFYFVFYRQNVFICAIHL
jgi:hypothetical protein